MILYGRSYRVNLLSSFVRGKMKIKIGTAPVSWGIMEVEGWNGQAPYAKVLDEMADAGYEGTELGPYGYLPSEPARLMTELSSRGLSMVSAFVPLPLAEPGSDDGCRAVGKRGCAVDRPGG